jgi:hypothetical protein
MGSTWAVIAAVDAEWFGAMIRWGPVEKPDAAGGIAGDDAGRASDDGVVGGIASMNENASVSF